MARTQTCHLPYRFVNGRQRCSRCGAVLEVEGKAAQDRHFWVCRNDDGSPGEFVGPAAAFLAHQHPCDEKPWVDEMGHLAGAPTGGKQSCARCGEDLTWIFPKEPLPTGTECTITIEASPGEYVKHSGRLEVARGTPPLHIATRRYLGNEPRPCVLSGEVTQGANTSASAFISRNFNATMTVGLSKRGLSRSSGSRGSVPAALRAHLRSAPL